jgi:hypothetical protein
MKIRLFVVASSVAVLLSGCSKVAPALFKGAARTGAKAAVPKVIPAAAKAAPQAIPKAAAKSGSGHLWNEAAQKGVEYSMQQQGSDRRKSR